MQGEGPEQMGHATFAMPTISQNLCKMSWKE
jgi:hypothetical protein